MRQLAPLLAAVLTLLLAVAPPPAQAEEGGSDTVVLADGRTVRGEIVAEDAEFVSIRSEGVLRAYAKDGVRSITRAQPAEETEPADTAAQEPGESAEEAAPSAAPEGPRRRRAARGDDRPQALSEQALAWLTTVLDLVRSPAGADPAVRGSLAAALRALGPAAIPAIRAAADDADEAAASVLRRVAAAIEAEAGARGGPEGSTTDGPGGDRARRRDLVAELGLGREQGQAAREILREHVRSVRAIVRQGRADGTARDELRAAVVDLRRATLDALKAVLEPDQAERLDGIAAELFRRLESRGGARREDGGRRKTTDAPAPE